MTSRVGHYRLFWQEFRRTFTSTGAVLPSGPVLCRALARYVATSSGEKCDQPRRILEVGPGTGVVTDSILRRMGSRDTLELVELNERFVDLLRQRLDADPQWRAAASRVHIHQAPVEDFLPDTPFDAIVSGLPLNNFPVATVEQILAHLARLGRPGATLSFFEYVAIREAKTIFSRRAERTRLRGIGRTLSTVIRQRRFERQLVLANVPPAWVHHLRLPDGSTFVCSDGDD